MTGIIVGANTGLQGNSSQTLGSQGLIGNPNLGRNGENVYVNAQTGNLVIQSQDSYLSGVGPDLPILETYNSLTTSTDTIKDYWNPSVVQNIKLTSVLAVPQCYVARVWVNGNDVVTLRTDFVAPF